MPVISTFGAMSAKGFGFTNEKPIAYPFNIEFLVIGGGGGGGKDNFSGDARGAGGGGAGGYRTSTQSITGKQIITVTVGDGGAAGSATPNSAGSPGLDSSISPAPSKVLK
jgi:hypothetical protein